MLDPRTLLAEHEAKEVDPAKASAVLELARRMATAKDRLDELTDEAKGLKKTYDHIRLEELPDAMHEAGMVAATGKGGFTLQDGRKVFLQSDMHVALPAGDRPAFYVWLEKNGHGDLLVEHVHPSTLKAFCKEQVAEGNELPATITTHPFLKAVLRKA
ncbi:hypothetical protein LCGC14_0252440 [marine sediment metagenome]|uniref:Uncharacterized protein n=1 Tax=marine sediment metagenome TaxID=412755 RepID=A0A0F9UL48_9ZZZZ